MKLFALNCFDKRNQKKTNNKLFPREFERELIGMTFDEFVNYETQQKSTLVSMLKCLKYK